MRGLMLIVLLASAVWSMEISGIEVDSFTYNGGVNTAVHWDTVKIEYDTITTIRPSAHDTAFVMSEIKKSEKKQAYHNFIGAIIMFLCWALLMIVLSIYLTLFKHPRSEEEEP